MERTGRFAFLRSIDPGVLILPFLGFLLMGAGLIGLYLIGQVHTLTCTREAGQRFDCDLVTTWMDLRQLSVRPVPQLSSAYVQENCDEDGCTYRVVLSSRFGDLPLTSAYSSGKADKQNTANQITHFLTDSSQPSVNVSEGGGLFVLLPVVFIGVGVYLCSTALKNLFTKW